jgi:hypothetical protein
LSEISSKPEKSEWVSIMNQQFFVPVNDDIIYNHPDQIEGPLVPYIAGMECHEWLSIEINPDESKDLGLAVSSPRPVLPKLRLVYSAS